MDGRSDGHDDGPGDAQREEGDAGEAGDASEESPERTQTSESQNGGGWLLDRWEQVTLLRVLVGITVVALALRLVDLGARSAHWDEARVAYWAYFYTDTGSVGYHWEEHGPLVQLVAGRLFEFLGANDFTARLPVAVAGGLFPLSAYLFRKHLRRTEVIGLALFFTLNPVLLYYSRFMRSDVLVAVFMFTAFGFLVRYYDTRLLRYVVLAGVFVGLGFGSKENASIYVLTWAGATALLVDQYLHSPAGDESGLDRLRSRFGDTFSAAFGFLSQLHRPREAVKSHKERGTLGRAIDLVATGVLLVVGFVLSAVTTIVFLFAPRGEGLAARGDPFGPFRPIEEPTTLDETIQDPTLLPQLVDDTLRMTYDGYKEWFTDSGETALGDYLETLVEGYLDFLVGTLPLLVALALIGFVLERYVRRRPRALVMFMCYCAIASLVGYPLGSDIGGDYAWVSSHIIVPLAVPAAVALATVYRACLSWLREIQFGRPAFSSLTGGGSFGRAEIGSLSVVAIVVVATICVSWLWLSPLGLVFVDDQAGDNELVQYAQPHSDLGPMVDSLERVAQDNDGADVVVYYGERGAQYDSNEALVHQDISPESLGGWEIRPLCSRWGNTQPLNWYFASTGANATCERTPQALSTTIAEEQPPVVVGTVSDSTLGFGENRAQQVPALDSEYERETYYIRTIGEEIVVYTHESQSG